MQLSTLAVVLFVSTVSAQHGPETAIRGTKQFSKRVVTSGLAGPWELTWGPDSKLWVTERTGKRIVRIDPVTGDRQVAVTIDEVSAPGGQDGLLGMALHPQLLKGQDYVYAAYTYVDEAKGAHPHITDPKSRYRFLYGKIVRLTYHADTGKLTDPQTVLSGLPAGNDHVAGRLKFGPDAKLYFTIGDQGNNQLGNFCRPIEAQRIPTAKELKAHDYSSYVGKSLRLNLDGSIPKDNPKINGVTSHVYTYGHRNPQGIDFGPDGTLYSSEQGPKSDDEVNILKPGANYGWPNVAGFQDNKAYEFARWAEASTPCSDLRFSDLAIHPSVPREPETAFKKKFVEPLATLFSVPTGYNFADPKCKGIDFICWPTVAVSSVEHYGSTGIPGWDRVLLVTSLKRGSLWVVPLAKDGKSAAGFIHRYFQAEDRYRDTAISPDGRTIYIATDPGGLAGTYDGGTTTKMEHPGAILAFTYTGEGDGSAAPITSAKPVQTEAGPQRITGGLPPQFTAAQVATGKTAYNANCAVCHGSTMTNGTFGTPLAGEYFKTKWSGRAVGAFFDKAQKTMPPASPASLPAETYANVVAYILEFNGAKPGNTPLPAGGDTLGRMVLP